MAVPNDNYLTRLQHHAQSESIQWFDPSDVQPDESELVLLHVDQSRAAVGSEVFPVYPGYFEEGCWRWADRSRVVVDVIEWAAMPKGSGPVAGPATVQRKAGS